MKTRRFRGRQKFRDGSGDDADQYHNCIFADFFGVGLRSAATEFNGLVILYPPFKRNIAKDQGQMPECDVRGTISSKRRHVLMINGMAVRPRFHGS